MISQFIRKNRCKIFCISWFLLVLAFFVFKAGEISKEMTVCLFVIFGIVNIYSRITIFTISGITAIMFGLAILRFY